MKETTKGKKITRKATKQPKKTRSWLPNVASDLGIGAAGSAIYDGIKAGVRAVANVIKKPQKQKKPAKPKRQTKQTKAKKSGPVTRGGRR